MGVQSMLLQLLRTKNRGYAGKPSLRVHRRLPANSNTKKRRPQPVRCPPRSEKSSHEKKRAKPLIPVLHLALVKALARKNAARVNVIKRRRRVRKKQQVRKKQRVQSQRHRRSQKRR